MIKVLEHGTRKITCPYCKAKLQYEQEDIVKKSIPTLLGEDEIKECIICPDCNETIFLSPIKR